MEVWIRYYDFGKKKTVRGLRTIEDDFDSDDQSKDKVMKSCNEESSVSKQRAGDVNKMTRR